MHMENLHTSNEGQQCPCQIIKDFKSTFTRIQDVKDTLWTVFASSHSDYLDPAVKEEISFHMNQVYDLITRIEKFNN